MTGRPHVSLLAWMVGCVAVFVAGLGITLLVFNHTDHEPKSDDLDVDAPFAIATAADQESVCAWVGPLPLRVSLPESTVRNITPSAGGTFRDWALYWPYGTKPVSRGETPAVRLPNGTVVANGDVGEVFCAGTEGTLYWPMD